MDALIDLMLIPLAKVGVVLFGFGLAIGALLTLAERRQSAFIQRRRGPNRANLGPFRLGGLLHIPADGIKSFLKEDFVPAGANKVLHMLAPALGVLPAMLLFAIVPFMDQWCHGTALPVGGMDICFADGEALAGATAALAQPGQLGNYFQIADLHAGVLYMFAVAGISVYGAAVAGWASNNKFALLGGLRASAQMVSYEVSMGLSIAGLLMIYGTLDLNDMVRQQGTLLFGFIPMWGILVQPLGFILFLTASIAESKRAPFDMPECESELVAGYFTEYSALKFAMFFLGEFMTIVFIGAITATLFLGGWHVPWLYADGFHFTTETMMQAANVGAISVGDVQAYIQSGQPSIPLPYWLVVALRIGAFVAKVLFMCAMQLQLRWTVPRFRYDQVMRLGWKVLLPLAIANVFITAIVILIVE